MAVTDIASRTYNHGWRLDPIVRSLLDTDFYKLLMLQMIREFYPDQRVTFSVINRTKQVRLAEVIDESELRAQLDHARSIRFTKKELIWLAGNTFYGKTQMFSPEFINYLSTFRLPEYELNKVDGQYELNFNGPWTHTTMWEIPALAILNELRSRQVMKGQGRFALDVLYARAKAKLWTKVERLRKLENLRLSDFGTRRRHGFLWQRWCVEAVKEGLGPSFIGTSNVLLAMDNDLEAIGTNAHELPMVAAALAKDDEELRWGTNLTNDFVGCPPDGSFNLDPISLVCKVSSADGHPAVKLSDNPEKATGLPSEIERYLRVFGDAGRVRKPVLV